MPAAGDVPYVSAPGDTPCGFANVLLVCRRLAARPLTFGLAALCCFRDGCGRPDQNLCIFVYVYLGFCFSTHIRSSILSSIWSAFGLQSRPRFVRAGREHMTSS